MKLIRPATPGFLVTLIATILLAVVSFCVPYFKTIYFLRASVTSNGVSGSITFGTLGYCLELSNGTTCSKPSIGYELDINGLVGNNLPVKIPQVVVKWITYALFLHIVALILSAGSAVFGLLAHVREISMTCCSTCVSGFAAAVALIAFFFDLAFFFLAKSRINAVKGGSATIGNAIWLTLAAWILLFFSGCFYSIGRCCISNRGPRNKPWDRKNGDREAGPGGDGYAGQMRLDAVKAEADRKAKQSQAEVGLPSFQEHVPLKKSISSDEVHLMNDDHHDYNNGGAAAGYGRRPSQNSGYAGYAQAPAGTRAVDEYYNPTGDQTGSSYPPQPQRQSSGHTLGPSGYTPANNAYAAPGPAAGNQYLAVGQQHGQDRYSTPNDYGHTAGGTTYHSATSHQQYPTNYTDYDAYGAHTAQRSQHAADQGMYYNAPSHPAYAPQSAPGHQVDRSYTLGGGYGGSSVSPQAEHAHNSSYFPYSDSHVASSSPAPINIPTSPVKGPRAMASPVREAFNDSPPSYDPGLPQASGGW